MNHIYTTEARNLPRKRRSDDSDSGDEGLMYTAFGRSALHTRTHLDMVYSLGNSTGSPKVPCQRSMANHRNGHIWEGLERLVGWRWGGVLMGKRAWERLSFCQPAQLQGPVGWDLGRHAGGKVEKMTASSFWGCVQSPLLHWGPDATLTQQTTPRDFCGSNHSLSYEFTISKLLLDSGLVPPQVWGTRSVANGVSKLISKRIRCNSF